MFKSFFKFKQLGRREYLVLLVVVLVPLTLVGWFIRSAVAPFYRLADWRKQWSIEGVYLGVVPELPSWKSNLVGPVDYVYERLLVIRNNRPLEDNLQKIMQLDRLEGLVVRGSKVTKSQVETLSRHPALKVVILCDTGLSQAEIKTVGGVQFFVCDQAPIVDLRQAQARFSPPWSISKFSGASVPKLTRDLVQAAEIEEVEHVDMRNEFVNPKVLQSLAGVDSLRYLFLGYGFDDSMVDLLAPMKSLVQIDLSQTMVTDEGAKKIAQLPQLQLVTLGPNMGDESLKVFATRSNVVAIDCQYSQVGDEGVESLRDSESLRALDLSNRPITGRAMDALVTVKNLRELSVSECTNLAYEDYAKLTKLNDLDRLRAPLSRPLYDLLYRTFPSIDLGFQVIGGRN